MNRALKADMFKGACECNIKPGEYAVAFIGENDERWPARQPFADALGNDRVIFVPRGENMRTLEPGSKPSGYTLHIWLGPIRDRADRETIAKLLHGMQIYQVIIQAPLLN